jgi:hypothetical protein
MSENNNEQMDLGSGTANNNNTIDDVPAPATSPDSQVTTTDNTISKLKLAIKTPKEKKDVSIDGSSTVKQVYF